MTAIHGACFCRAVTFTTTDPAPRPVAVCHCKQCRQFSGYTWAATAVLREKIQIQGQDQVRWFQSSSQARRGFCQICGSTLFWDQATSPRLSIAAGVVDNEEVLTLGKHIYVKDKPAYYAIAQGEPQYALDREDP